MNQVKPMLYKCAATWGRMRLPHTGHCELIEQCLANAEYADVHLSAHEKNNSFEMRVLLLKVMLRKRNVDLSRVRFFQSKNVNEALQQSIADAPFNEVVFVLGSDQVDLLYSMSAIHDVNYVINRRSNSSTMIRCFLDSYDFLQDAIHLYDNCEYATALAYVIRQEERQIEKSCQVAK